MTTALGDECITKKLFSNELGSASKPIDTAYITNIVPPPGGGATPTLQEVCDTGNSTTTPVLTPQINENQATDTLHLVGKVGIGVNPADPITEDLEVDGNIQVDTSGLGRLVFYDKQADHEHCEFDGDDDGVNGGQAVIKTKADGGSVQTRMVIRESGNVGINTTTPAERLDVNGNIQSKGYIGDTGQCAFKFRRVPLTSYLTASTTGTGTINTATTMGVDDWNLSYTVRSTGSINQLNLRITKPLPTGVPVFGNCRPKVFLSNSGTTPRPATYAICDSAGSNDFQITVVWSSAIPNGDFGYVWLEIDQLL
jgi:hypothetical protein